MNFYYTSFTLLHYDTTTGDLLDFLVLCRAISIFYDDSIIFDGRTDTNTSPYILQFQTTGAQAVKGLVVFSPELEAVADGCPSLRDLRGFRIIHIL